MHPIVLLALVGGFLAYAKGKATTAANTSQNPGLNASSLNILNKGASATAADLAALTGGINAIGSAGTAIKNLFPSTPAMAATPSIAPSNDGTPGGDDFGTLTDGSAQPVQETGDNVDENYFDTFNSGDLTDGEVDG